MFWKKKKNVEKVYDQRGAGQFDEIQKQLRPTSAGVKSDLRYEVLEFCLVQTAINKWSFLFVRFLSIYDKLNLSLA